MPRGYSRDLRERLLQAVASGLARSEVAVRTGVSRRTLARWQQKQDRGESLDIAPRSGGLRKIARTTEPALQAQVLAHPDATLAEHCARWTAAGHAPLSRATMSRALRRANLPLKKTVVAAERNEDVRQQWRADLAGLDPATCIFLDETSTQITLTRTRSRAPRGCRAVGQIPRNHGQNLSCLMAISPTGVLAPLVVPGAVDGQVFYQWITTWLLPLVPTGTTIILDNLVVHRHPRVRQAVAAAGCHLQFLPPYSPDFNPIEFVFAKLKAHLRRVAARTPDTVIAAIGSGLDLVTTTDLANCYRHCGYPLPDC